MSKLTWGMIFSAFLMNVGTFAIMTFLVVYLTQQLELPSWQVGTVLTANILCQRVSSVVMGALADGIGYRTALFSGVLLRGFGFLGYDMFHVFLPLLLSSAFIGCGAALYKPAMSAVFVAQDNKKVFTYYNQALNAGSIVGPLVGGLLIAWGAKWLFIWGASIYFAMALSFRFIPVTGVLSQTASLSRGYTQVFRDKSFLRFISRMILYWIVWQQFMVSLPVEANRVVSAAFVGQLFAMSGVFGLFAMFILRKQFERRNPLLLVRIGTLLVSLGLMAVPLWTNRWWLVICVAVFMVGETLVLPANDISIANHAAGRAAATYFGFGDLSTGIGCVVGSYLGTLLMHVGGQAAWPWVVYGGIGLLAAVGLARPSVSAPIPNTVGG